MLFEISVLPLGDVHLSEELASVLSVIDRSGLPYQLGASSTCIEGDWEEVMALIRDCHGEARRHSRHVVTLIKIEDDAGERGKMISNVTSVEERSGRGLATTLDGTPSAAKPAAAAEAAAGSGRAAQATAGKPSAVASRRS